MKKIIKIFSICISVIVGLIFSLIIYGEITLPDQTRIIGNNISFSGIYTASYNGDSISTVSVTSDNSNNNKNINIKLFGKIPVKNVEIQKTQRRYVVVGGELIGIRLKTKGVLIVGIESFESEKGNVSPASEAGIQQGDILLSINGENIETNTELCYVIENSDGKELELCILRDNKEFHLTLKPEKSVMTGSYKGGLWIRDSTGGIGTLTFTDLSKGTIASLGHGIYDVDTNTLMTAKDGYFTDAVLSGVTKGSHGTAGELRGSIGGDIYGGVLLNCDNGIYGSVNYFDKNCELIPVALDNEVKTGKAQIICTVNGNEKEYYDIEIEKIDISAENKNMIIKITDPDLIATTGGIVQGMSGSPIIQNDMLVGAVTHVFLNDPTKGYAILAETMIETADYAILELNKAS